MATYDLQPDDAYQVRDELLSRIDSGRYDLIVLNFANPDMVGTASMSCSEAVEVVDGCVGVVDRILSVGGAVLLTADHGNAEKMLDSDTGQPHTAHTTNPVPFSLITSEQKGYRLREDGILADVAPTALQLMNIPQPEAMTGRTLIIPG